MPSSPKKNRRLSVTVVSKNASTLDALEAYLRNVGVLGNSTGAIDRLLEVTPPSAAAVIVFPDEYEPGAAMAAVREASRQRPDILLVVVTSEPGRFDKLAGGADGEGSLLVMAKPAWAWTILDAIRARLARGAAEATDKSRTNEGTD
jgi:hypothetical protein